MRVLVTGATGFIGGALMAELQASGHVALPLVRGPQGSADRTWSVVEGRLGGAALDGVDAVVHLAGAPIGPRLNEAKRRAIMASRVDGTRLISAAVAASRPSVFVSGSAIGYYGDAGESELTESSPRGSGFLADVVGAWEAETEPAVEAGVRTVKIRTGLVIHGSGGLLGNILLPFKLGLGGPIGSGRQWWSWITLRDEIRAIIHCLESDSVDGAVNLAGPNPVRNTEFVKALGAALNRPSVMPLPAFALRALVGRQFADEAVLASQRVLPTKLEESGFVFSDPDVGPALASVV